MNRNKLKTYAPKARRDFIKAVRDRAAFYGLTKEKIAPVTEQGDVAIIGGKPFPRDVAKKRKRLEERIRREGFEQVMEAMAYTWFNRFVAIRYMELHGYLEHGYRVLSTTNNANGTNKGRDGGGGLPEILLYAEHVDLPGLNREKVVDLKLSGNRDEELYRMLLIAQCNALHKAMPFLFEWIGDATELLLPENLLHSDSLIRKMVSEIPEAEWEEVEIIGWLYQFYISEKKDQVIGKVVKSEDIPAATQLFTPNWIVKYMVQNTLGRQWVATYPDSPLKQKMEYYIEPAKQTLDVEEQLKAITPENLNPEELTLLDPACGSGHILVEAYDLFKAIYQERGYRAKDIPRLILEKNLYGLEIDDRAAQLAAFALMMKAMADDRMIFENGTRPHVLAIQESKGMDAQKITEALNAPIVRSKLPHREMLFEEMDEARAPLFSRRNLSVKGELSHDDVAQLIQLFEHGKTFGSLVRVPEELERKLPIISERVEDVCTYGEMFGKAAAEALRPIVGQAGILSKEYDAVVTNPPYMGSKFYNALLKRYVTAFYMGGKGDLYGCFIQQALEVTRTSGFVGMITIPNWMFLSTFEELRKSLLTNQTFETMVHNGRGIWGSDFGSCSFALRNIPLGAYMGVYRRLFDKQGSVATVEELHQRFFDTQGFTVDQHSFNMIPGCPLAYWVDDRIRSLFATNRSLKEIGKVVVGLQTGDNDRFLRLWPEVDFAEIGFGCGSTEDALASEKKWFPFSKGGDFRKWYGNQEYLVNWQRDGLEIKNFKDDRGKLRSRPQNTDFYFRPSVTCSAITVATNSFRYYPKGFVFDVNSRAGFYNSLEVALTVLAFGNSKLAQLLVSALNPTLAFNIQQYEALPIAKSSLFKHVAANCQLAIDIAKQDWDAHETSWEFHAPPILKNNQRDATVEREWLSWLQRNSELIEQTRKLEITNNRLLLEAYSLQGELETETSEDQITLYHADREEDTKRLISYSIGCMMGRYSLDQPGLIYAHSGNEQFWGIYYKKHNKPAPAQNNNHSSNSPAPLNRVPFQGVQPGCDSWSTFSPDQDGIIPVTDTDWFPDDAANRFIEFISVAWPKEHLEENLNFVAESLGPNRGELRRETIRRYMATGLFKHHMKMYKKRPIYWLFSSGKLRAFQCLVYLHRYNEGTLSRMRTEYVIPLQGKISARIEQLSGDINAATSTAHRKKLEREKDKLSKQQVELQAFDEKLRHYADQRISLDLDDGVKVNYGKFGDLLAEVKAVTGKK